MLLRAHDNGGIVTVGAGFGARLIEGGTWVEVSEDQPETTKTTRRTRRTAPAEEPETQE